MLQPVSVYDSVSGFRLAFLFTILCCWRACPYTLPQIPQPERQHLGSCVGGVAAGFDSHCACLPVSDMCSCANCCCRVARDRANATRLLKHPFVAGVLDQPRQPPAPTTPPSNAISSSNSSPGQPVSGGNTPSRLTAATSAPQGCCAAQHNGRQSAGVMAAGMNAHRPPTVGAMSAAQAAMKASRQSRSSPTQARSSPMRQQQHPADGSKAGGPLPAHGDAAAVVTAARSPLQPQPQQPKQQQEQLQKAQQQQHSPKPFDAYQHQQPQPQQQQQQQPQQPAEASNRASPAAPSAEASSASDVGQDACMTLVDWNPVTEPSWLPPYQPQPSGSKCQQAAAAVTSSQQQQPQQVSDKQQDGNHKGEITMSHCGVLQAS